MPEKGGKEVKMAISREQFNKELDKLQNAILEFLKQHPQEAYQSQKVTKGIGLTDRWKPESGGAKMLYDVAINWGVEGALNELAKRGLVDKKIIDGRNWYSIHMN